MVYGRLFSCGHVILSSPDLKEITYEGYANGVNIMFLAVSLSLTSLSDLFGVYNKVYIA